MNKTELCKSLLKIANKLDSTGKHVEANYLTSVANNLTKTSANFFGDLTKNLLNESVGGLIQNNVPELLQPSIANVVNNSLPGQGKSILPPAKKTQNNDAKTQIINAQNELLNKLYGQYGGDQNQFYYIYPELVKSRDLDSIYRMAYNIGKTKNHPRREIFQNFAKEIYTPYYVPDANLRKQLRALG